jgi:hypothetical protein
MVEWIFYKQMATDPIRNPIAGEFFSTEAVTDAAEALVREGIQNTLDARKTHADGSREQAVARIYLSETSGALSPKKAQRWFKSLWPHISAPRNGLRNHPSLDEPCPFLVFEDFGTIGLTGAPDKYEISEVKNNFLNFYRAEGHSDKGEHDRGSWGVGKTVFSRTSRISSFIGFTVRDDDKRSLMLGRSILKYHRVNGTSFKSDGYFGNSIASGLVLPSEDNGTIDDFRRDFKLARNNEPGLSLVVPWYDTSNDEGLTREMVLQAALRGFFYPILVGHLSLTIATPSSNIALNSTTLLAELKRIGGPLAQDLLPIINLAKWGQGLAEGDLKRLLAPDLRVAQRWAPEALPPDVITYVRDSLAQHNSIALRVPMAVWPREGDPTVTHFDVYLERSDKDNEKPVFIREELIIPDVRPHRVPNVRALVIVEDGPLAAFLRDAETPAHTQWNPESSNFKSKYKFGPGAIAYVRHSVSEIIRIVNLAERRPDPSLTIDFFSLPAPIEDDETVPARRKQPKPKPGGDPPPIPPTIIQRPKRFRIQPYAGGFSIIAGDPGAPQPHFLAIRLAYDTRRGNPLRRYHKADFDVSQRPIHFTSPGNTVKVEGASLNQILLSVQSPDFRFDVTGFDPERDLYIKADVKEPADADPTP